MSTVVPTIRGYKPFYISIASETGAGGIALATDEEWGMVAQSQPYPFEYKVKEPYKNEWPDRNGDEEYLENLYLEPFETEVKFYCKCIGVTAVAELATAVKTFLNDISAHGIAIYDSWQEMGYKGARIESSSVERRKIGDGFAWMIISVKFKINNPKNTATLSDGPGGTKVIS